jgi:hypothetical protein
MKIWCLFSVDNNYDQPYNNLVYWNCNKPTLEKLCEIIETENFDAVQEVLDGKEARICGADYRLEFIGQGKL